MTEPIRVRSRAPEPIRVQHREPVRVQSRPRTTVAVKTRNTVWERTGWARNDGPRGTIYTGRYRVWDKRARKYREYDGRLEQTAFACEAHVRQPPRALLATHPKRLCFRQSGVGGWYHMNWYEGTRDPDETIAYLTKVLGEALND